MDTLTQRDEAVMGSLELFIKYCSMTDERRLLMLICIRCNKEQKVKYLVDNYPHECHFLFRAKDTPWEYLSYANKHLLYYIFQHSTFSYKTSLKKLMNFAAQSNRIEAMRFFCASLPKINKDIENKAFLHLMKQNSSTEASETFFIQERLLDCSEMAYAYIKKKSPKMDTPHARYWIRVIQRMEKIALQHSLSQNLALKPQAKKHKI